MTCELQARRHVLKLSVDPPHSPVVGNHARPHSPTGNRRVNKGDNHESQLSAHNPQTHINKNKLTPTPLHMHLCTFSQIQTIAAASAGV